MKYIYQIHRQRRRHPSDTNNGAIRRNNCTTANIWLFLLCCRWYAAGCYIIAKQWMWSYIQNGAEMGSARIHCVPLQNRAKWVNIIRIGWGMEGDPTDRTGHKSPSRIPQWDVALSGLIYIYAQDLLLNPCNGHRQPFNVSKMTQ